MDYSFKLHTRPEEFVTPHELFNLSDKDFDKLLFKGELYLNKALSSKEPFTYLRAVEESTPLGPRICISAECGNAIIRYTRSMNVFQTVYVSVFGDPRKLFTTDISVYFMRLVQLRSKFGDAISTNNYEGSAPKNWYVPSASLDVKLWLEAIHDVTRRAKRVAFLNKEFRKSYGFLGYRATEAIQSRANACNIGPISVTSLSNLVPYREESPGYRGSGYDTDIRSWVDSLEPKHAEVIKRPHMYYLYDMTLWMAMRHICKQLKTYGANVEFEDIAFKHYSKDQRVRIVESWDKSLEEMYSSLGLEGGE